MRAIYHPSASGRSSGTSSECYTDFECLCIETSACDFIIHFDDEAKSESLHNLLNSINLLQQLNSPTHKTGHTLTLVIRSDSDNLLYYVVV